MKTIILLRGCPGSGKSSLSKLINAGLRVEADQYHMVDGIYDFKLENIQAAHEWCQQQVNNGMRDGIETIVVSNTFTQLREMEPYFELAKKYKYRVSTLVTENRHRSKDIHNVPEGTIAKMKDRFEIIL